MPVTDARAVLADIHLHSRDYQNKAADEFAEVLKLQPDNAAALRGLGYAYLMKRDFHRSGEYFTQAAAHDSNDPRVFYYSALLAQMEHGPEFVSDPVQLAKMQKELERSIALDPEFAGSYHLLAFVYLSQGKHKTAASTIRKAFLLNPRNEWYALNLAQMDMAIERYDESLGLLKLLCKSSDSNIAASASETMTIVEMMKSEPASALRLRIEINGPSTESAQGSPASSETVTASTAMAKPVRFLKGKLVAVDCSTAPKAVLTVKSGTATWTFNVADTGHVAVIGADRFSCGWKSQDVAVNYRESGPAIGDVVSIEVQQ